ncbi:MAG: hypothetical protein OXG08_08680 [Gammaproteobacteria bacterium]|nr:hypothetical protein [Gammaproteobacteria bacterium]
MKTHPTRTTLIASGFVAVLLVFAVWVFAQSQDEETTDDSCEWQFVGNHTSTDAKGHFWNECTGDLFYVVGTDVQKANVPMD